MTNAVPQEVIQIANRNLGAIPFYLDEDTDFKKIKIARMAVKSEPERTFNKLLSKKQEQGRGMTPFKIEVYNQLLEYFLSNGGIRNAALLVLSGNWGARFGDIVRVRFCHIFDEQGEIKESFSLPNGEDKTNKLNVYYNNKATALAIEMLIAENPDKTRDDYLFTSNSRNKPMIDLELVEAEELYKRNLEKAEDDLDDIYKAREKARASAIKGEITVKELSDFLKECDSLEASLKVIRDNERANIRAYHNESSHGRQIQRKISHTAAEDIIKDGLASIGIFGQNCKKGNTANDSGKYNTHSFRKTFGEYFYNRGVELKDRGILTVDPDILKLLQDKFMHSSSKITQHYDSHTEQAFEIICTHLNLGLDVLEKYRPTFEQIGFEED